MQGVQLGPVAVSGIGRVPSVSPSIATRGQRIQSSQIKKHGGWCYCEVGVAIKLRAANRSGGAPDAIAVAFGMGPGLAIGVAGGMTARLAAVAAVRKMV